MCISKATHLFTAVFEVITVLGLSCKLVVPVYWYYLEQAVQLICFRGLSTGQLCLISSTSSPPAGVKIDYKTCYLPLAFEWIIKILPSTCAASLQILSSWDISELSKLLNLLQIVNDLHFLINPHKLCISLQSSLCVFGKKTRFTCIRYDMWKRFTGLSGHSTWMFSACFRYQNRRVGGGTAWHSRTHMVLKPRVGFSLWEAYFIAWGNWTYRLSLFA